MTLTSLAIFGAGVLCGVGIAIVLAAAMLFSGTADDKDILP